MLKSALAPDIYHLVTAWKMGFIRFFPCLPECDALTLIENVGYAADSNTFCKLCQLRFTPLQNRTQVRFWFPIKIPAGYVSLMAGLPENSKNEILRGGTYFTLKFTL